MAALEGERFISRNGNVGKPVRRTQGTGAHEDDGIAGFAIHLHTFTMGESCLWKVLVDGLLEAKQSISDS